MDDDEKNFKMLEVASDIRKFEIDLFWRRSTFFWGFTAIAAVAYGVAYSRGEKLQFAAACVGFACSITWSLVNRSSKYWQKQWETKGDRASRAAVGSNFFAQIPTERASKFPWWDAHFSVSKLATAFSDFTAGVWIGLAFKASQFGGFIPRQYLICIAFIFTMLYVVYVFICCRPDDPPISD